METLSRPGHDFRSSLETFPDLDVSRVASELQLETSGSERGAKDEPLAGSAAMDEVEARILERVESVRKSSHAILEDELRTYGERLSNLDFEARFGSIRTGSKAVLASFNAEVAKGINDLHDRRRHLRETEREYETFRKRHHLERTAYVPSGLATALKWSLLVFLGTVEAVLNGYFLSAGNLQGLLGGFSEAVAFAFINIGWAFLLARGASLVHHRSVGPRLAGLLCFSLYALGCLGFNLALAHYREATIALAEGGGREVIERLRTAPLGLKNFNSWVYFAIGSLFSLIAFIDAHGMMDPYPGFAKLEKKLSEKRDSYRDEVAGLIDELADIRDRFKEEMEMISRDLSVKRSEHENILISRTRLIHLFDQHQAQLERAGNTLLTIYREPNTRTRTTKPPRRFSQSWKMDRVQALANVQTDWEPKELGKRISEAQDLLTAELTLLYSQFDEAIRRYRSLDEIVPEQDVVHVKAA